MFVFWKRFKLVYDFFSHEFIIIIFLKYDYTHEFTAYHKFMTLFS